MNASNDIPLFAYVSVQAVELHSLYSGNTRDQARLLDFMDENRWFGGTETWKGGQLLTQECEKFYAALPLWLKAFGKAPDEKISILLDEYESDYPETVQGCRKYLDAENAWKSPASLLAADHLIYAAKEGNRELTAFREEDLRLLLISASERIGPAAFASLDGMLRCMMPALIRNWSYSLDHVHFLPEDISAYPPNVYTGFAWFLFNEDSWKRSQLLEKAMDDPAYARRWLFVSMTYVCALRGTDLTALPAPTFTEPAPVAARRILDSADRDHEAEKLSEKWERELRLLSLKPSKTARFSNVPSLKIFIPKKLRAPIGVILAISLLHMDTPETPLMISGFPVPYMRNFFGQEAVDLLQGRDFSIRRATKSFLQGIQWAAACEKNSLQGYLLASLARSHKGGYQTLPESTDIYLKDAAFAGYSPDFALRHMLERGTFSWITSILLESFDSKTFHSITVQGQTEAILAVGLKPAELEAAARYSAEMSAQSSQAVSRLFQSTGTLSERLKSAMDTIAGDHIQQRCEGSHCLLSAVEEPCAFADRTSCVGCRYEICGAAVLHSLLKEYISLHESIRKLSGPDDAAEKARLKAIASKGLLPVLTAFIRTWETLYPGSDTSVFTRLINKCVDLLKKEKG